MSFEELSDRLRVLQNSNADLKDMIQRLETINFQPGSLPLDSEGENTKTEWTTEIHQTLITQKEVFELLGEDVAELGRQLETGGGDKVEQERLGLERAARRGIFELEG